jgi:hypothetical protein
MAKKTPTSDVGMSRGGSGDTAARTTGSRQRKEPGMADDSPRNADFIGRVVSDPKNPPETRMLTGWLGDAADEGYRRLYTDAELSAYIDIPNDAILHGEPIRDAQPAGSVFVWIKRDAAVKPGGSAASRAARFLEGQVQQDFASGGVAAADPGAVEKAGFRCITQVPCGEPTGFTGRCTLQPEVGGAWPCITAIPHCFEPTGFTGRCTHQPWPNPTHYIGCTFLHCPTQDLTHNPHICNMVATGMPGCVVVNPPQGAVDPAANVDAAAGEKEGGGSAAVHPTPPVTIAPGCGHTHIPGCGYTQTWGLCPTHPPKCNVSVDIPCITRDAACGITRNPACLANAGGGGFAAFRAAGPGIPIGTLLPSCDVSAAGACPSALDNCPTVHGCLTVPPTAMASCTQIGPHCPTKATICTQTGPQCPTSCGPDCQTQQMNCTQVGEICLTHPVECTQFGPKCPSIGVVCPTPQMACTKVSVGCPSVAPCTSVQFACGVAQPAQRFAVGDFGRTDNAFGGGCPPFFTFVQCQLAPPDFTLVGLQCLPTNVGCPPTAAVGPQCPHTFEPGCPPRSHAVAVCTFFGPQCPPPVVGTAAGPRCQMR